MILATVKMNVILSKRKEFLQAACGLIDRFRDQKHCLNCHLYMDVEQENVLYLVAEYATKKNLTDHLKSQHFNALLGAMSLLCESYEIKVNSIAGTLDLEGLKKHAQVEKSVQ